jgi:hypothetical protein
MMTRRLFFVGLALIASAHRQGSATTDPISEELAFTYIWVCGGEGTGWGTTCATPVLAEGVTSHGQSRCQQPVPGRQTGVNS